jgi:hypothetical protein
MSNQAEGGFAAWRKKNKFRLHSILLTGIMGGSLALYWALEAGRNALAAVLAGVVALCMLTTIVVS